ncbi:MAG: peptidylprolyl isomerase [Burkholderiales bacterium]
MTNFTPSPSLSDITAIARVNGVALHRDDEVLTDDELRQRAYSELLRQAAIRDGLLAASDYSVTVGVLSEDASNAIETLLEKSLTVPEPSDQACRRHYLAHQAVYTTGERVRARHILFAVTDGVDVAALRSRAEATLLEVRCHDGKTTIDAFANAARTLSNCPSGADGGDLGWLVGTDCAPEFAKEIFGQAEIGVLPRLVHSRFGFHVVEVLEREPGVAQPFESVRNAVTMALQRKTYMTALQQYLRLLVEEAVVDGVKIG